MWRVCLPSYSGTAHFGPILLMRGGRFIHGGESGDHSNPLFLIWSGLRTTPPGAVSFIRCVALPLQPTRAVRSNFSSRVVFMLQQHRLLILAMVLACVPGWPSYKAEAQQAQQDYSQINPRPTHRGPTLSDVWGPPKMPPEPKDFGPHFDFPAGGSENFNCGSGSGYYCGAPSEAPYPH